MNQEVFPVFDQILKREDKEKFLNQRAKVIWLTGLSCAGKTTIARHLELELNERGYFTQVLDGDNIRTGLNKDLGFATVDRFENIRRIAEVTSLFLNCGIICINSFITPTNEIRAVAYEIIGPENILEIFVHAPLEICEQRDKKGLYKKAREGKIMDFTGISAPFEEPENPALKINTHEMTVTESVTLCLRLILSKVKYI